jgi:hypothetical protein
MRDNRYLKRDGNHFPRYNEYMAKRDEVARHREWQRTMQSQMQPYRGMREMDSRRGVRGTGNSNSDYRRGMDGTEYEYQSAFELPYGHDSARSGRRDYEPYGHEYYYPPLASQDYARGRRDYGHEEKDYEEDLEEWIEKLKKKDRFRIKKEDIINSAKTMGVKFDEFSEEEFYAVYLMMVSDYKAVANDFRSYLNMAKEWLMDDDIEVSPSEKVCIYMYEIVKGEGVK